MRSRIPLALPALALLTLAAPAFAQLTDVDCVALVDANGARIARATHTQTNVARFYLGHNGLAIPFQIEAGTLLGNEGAVLFTDATCLSAPYVHVNADPHISPVSAIAGTEAFYGDPAAIPQPLGISSQRRYDGVCQAIAEVTISVVPALTFTFPAHVVPFHLEPESCTSAESVAALTPRNLLALVAVFAFIAFVVRRRPAVLAALAMLMLAPAARADEIFGCIGERKGILRIVASLSECKASETPISWNVTGPPGEPGTDGVDGKDGEPGADGSDAAVPHVFDGTGNDLGVFAGDTGTAETIRVLHESLGVTFLVGTRTGELVVGRVVYEEPACSGRGFTDWFLANSVIPNPLEPTSLLLGSRTVYVASGQHQSAGQVNSGCEVEVEGHSDKVEVEPFAGDLGITFPVALPLWVGLARTDVE